MLSKVWSPLKPNQEGGEMKYRPVQMGSLCSSMSLGLRILTEPTSDHHRDSNVVINSGLKLIKPIFHTIQYSPSSSLDDCFLKSCFLCNKPLSLDKEVYMYRGDQGFCSVECRSRQIHLDEMKEIEISTRRTLASIRRCPDSNRCSETRNLLEEYRQRHRPMSCQKNRAIFLY